MQTMTFDSPSRRAAIENVVPGMTIGEARRTLADAFRGAGLDAPELDARLLVGHAAGLDHTAIVASEHRSCTVAEAAKLAELAQRRLAREPVARILGTKEFWGLALLIASATLVPRPETETVVEAALAAIDEGGARTRPLRVADLGTGSGAILLALLSELPNAFGVGTDVSTDALNTARKNANKLGLSSRAAFAICDFGEGLGGGFDLVVSNPPYIPTGDIFSLSPEVRCDPLRALDGGIDGLASYRAIAKDVSRLISPSGRVVLELGLGQAESVAKLLHLAGLSPTQPRLDLGGIPRTVAAGVATMTR